MKSAFDCLLLAAFLAWVAGVALAVRARRLANAAAGAAGMSGEQERGWVSWYGEGYRGKAMANGQPFDPEAMTCAAWRWPIGSLLRVRHPASGRYVIVEVTDRGPARWTGCVVDLSARAFRKVEVPGRGKFVAVIEVLRTGPEPVRAAQGETGGAR